MNELKVVLAGESLNVTVPDDEEYYADAWKSWESGDNENELFNFIQRFADRDGTFFDIGAWIGCATLPSARKFKKVLSYEAEPKSFDLLKSSVILNRFDNVELIQKFASDSTGTVTMYAPGDLGVSNSSGLLSAGKHQWNVEKVRVDSDLESALLKGNVVMKIDIEGSEYDVIPTLIFSSKNPRLKAVCLSLHPFIISRSINGNSITAKLARRWKLYKATRRIMPFINSFTVCVDSEGNALTAYSLLFNCVFRGNLKSPEREIYLWK